MQKPNSHMENPYVGVPATAPNEDPAVNHMNYKRYNLVTVKMVPALNICPDPGVAQWAVSLSCKKTKFIIDLSIDF